MTGKRFKIPILIALAALLCCLIVLPSLISGKQIYRAPISSGHIPVQIEVQHVFSTTNFLNNYEDVIATAPPILDLAASFTQDQAAYHENLTPFEVPGLTGISRLQSHPASPTHDNKPALANFNLGAGGPPDSFNHFHTVVGMDLPFHSSGPNPPLNPPDPEWSSYTTDPGQDYIKGIRSEHIPDGGTTLVFLGIALSGLFFAGCLFSKK